MSGSNQDNLLGGPDQQSWEAERASKRKRAPYKSRTLINKRQTLKTLAQGFEDGDECYRAAKSNSSKNLASSWALVQACIEYRGFTSLEKTLENPWTAIIKKQWPSSAKLIAKLIAMRGANVELDVGLCTQQGLEFRNFKEIVLDAEGEKNTLVVFRGKVMRSGKRRGKQRFRLSTDFGEVELRSSEKSLKIKSADEQLVLGYFRSTRLPKDASTSAEVIYIVDLLSVYSIGSPSLH